MSKPLASLSLDLDNQWSYMKTHGDPGWEELPSYLDVLVPTVLSFLAERDLRITFFVVGQDAALARNHQALRAIADDGHEIGNHSFRHEPWFHLYSEEQIERELALAEQVIGEATGQRPIGFRGPGFSLTRTTLQVLLRRGYRYDATTLPTFIGPLARAYYFMSTKLSREQREERKHLFGGMREGLRPLKPYRWQLEGGHLIEVPVTTMPYLRAPTHVSYLLYLSTYSEGLAKAYLRSALGLCAAEGVQPSLLLHPLDFLGSDDVDALSFFPGMKLPGAIKRERVGEYVAALTDAFAVQPLCVHAAILARQSDLRSVEPRFWQREAGAAARERAGVGQLEAEQAGG